MKKTAVKKLSLPRLTVAHLGSVVGGTDNTTARGCEPANTDGCTAGGNTITGCIPPSRVSVIAG